MRSGLRSLQLCCLIIGAALAGCEEPLPPARPTTVRITNRGPVPLFLGGNLLHFTFKDAAGRFLLADPGPRPLCSHCEEICSSPHSDFWQSRTWIEVPPGWSSSVDTEGRLYRTVRDGCRCDHGGVTTCVEPLAFADGDYQIEVSFALAIIGPCTEPRIATRADGTTTWNCSEHGTAIPDRSRSFPVRFEGQPTIEVSLP